MNQVVDRLYSVPLGAVNVFLLDCPDGLTLIDTGYPGSADLILAAGAKLGRQPSDVKQIIVTHCHSDHAGGLAELKRRTGATIYMHPADAVLVEAGQVVRPSTAPAPGLLNQLLFRAFIRRAPTTVEPVTIDRLVTDGEELPVAGGLRVIHAPGHSAGQVALLWPQQGGVLFAADAAANNVRLGWMISYEDLALGRQTLARLAGLDFTTAVFGHGSAIIGGASRRFAAKWSM